MTGRSAGPQLLSKVAVSPEGSTGSGKSGLPCPFSPTSQWGRCAPGTLVGQGLRPARVPFGHTTTPSLTARTLRGMPNEFRLRPRGVAADPCLQSGGLRGPENAALGAPLD